MHPPDKTLGGQYPSKFLVYVVKEGEGRAPSPSPWPPTHTQMCVSPLVVDPSPPPPFFIFISDSHTIVVRHIYIVKIK
jgi:hypothetical protein